MRLTANRGMLAIGALAVFAAVTTAIMAIFVFPHGSSNNDEGVYLLQAHTLAHGHLFMPVGAHPRAQQPWFFVARSGHYVSKYLPALSAMFALSIVVTGQFWPLLAIFAGLLPVAVFALAREVGVAPNAAWGAAAAVSLSPLVLVQSALVLSYVPFALAAICVWLLMFQLMSRGGSAWRALLVGMLVMFCASIRPYDTVLLNLPFAWQLLRTRQLARIRSALLIVLGALPFAALIGWYDNAATGNPFRLPFNVLEPSDKIGFGVRRLFPEDSRHSFGVWQAIQGEFFHFLLEPLTWFLFGIVVIPAAIGYVFFREHRTERGSVIVASVVVFLVGYFIFWGPYNASVLWGGPGFIGPFYALAILAPLAIVGVPVAIRAWRRWPAIVVAVGVGALVLNGLQLTHALRIDVRDTHRTQAVLTAVNRLPADQTIMVQTDPAYLGHPVSALFSLHRFPDQVLGAEFDPASLDQARAVTLLTLDPNFYGPSVKTFFTLVPQRRISGSFVQLDLRAAPAPQDAMAIAVGDRVTGCSTSASLRVEAAAVQVTCPQIALPSGRKHGMLAACPTRECIDITLYRRGSDGKLSVRSIRRVVIGQRGGQLVTYVDRGAPIVTAFGSVTSPSPDSATSP